jgi:hypothetical protein
MRSLLLLKLSMGSLRDSLLNFISSWNIGLGKLSSLLVAISQWLKACSWWLIFLLSNSLNFNLLTFLNTFRREWHMSMSMYIRNRVSISTSHWWWLYRWSTYTQASSLSLIPILIPLKLISFSNSLCFNFSNLSNIIPFIIVILDVLLRVLNYWESATTGWPRSRHSFPTETPLNSQILSSLFN